MLRSECRRARRMLSLLLSRRILAATVKPLCTSDADAMREHAREFWQLSTRSIFVLVAIYGPILAGYGIAIRVIFGFDKATDHAVGVVTTATFVSGGIAVIYAILLSYARGKKGKREERGEKLDDISHN